MKQDRYPGSIRRSRSVRRSKRRGRGFRKEPSARRSHHQQQGLAARFLRSQTYREHVPSIDRFQPDRSGAVRVQMRSQLSVAHPHRVVRSQGVGRTTIDWRCLRCQRHRHKTWLPMWFGLGCDQLGSKRLAIGYLRQHRSTPVLVALQRLDHRLLRRETHTFQVGLESR